MESQNKLKVSSGAYRKAFIGEEVCLALHPGSLQAQWYRPVECESQTAPPHEQ
jgi:hypothetical protein